MMDKELEGLGTNDALQRLHDDIKETVDDYKRGQLKRNRSMDSNSLLYGTIHHSSPVSVFRWTSCLVLTTEAIFLLIAYAVGDKQRYQYFPVQAFLIFAFVLGNVYFMWWDSTLRHSELPVLTELLLKLLTEYKNKVSWGTRSYPHLHSPLSPCITLQWTKRDGNIVNLPWSLLVRGDVVLLRPGQKAPGKCRLATDDRNSPLELYLGDTFSPVLEGIGEGFSSPKARSPLQAVPYILLETPYITNLKILLSESLNRPVTVFNKLRHHLFALAVEAVILPLVLVLILLVNGVQLHYHEWMGHWTEVLFVAPVSVALPLVPPSLPLLWISLNGFGTSIILTIYHCAKKLKQKDPSGDPFEEAKPEALQLSELAVNWSEVQKHFFHIMLGKQSSPTRTANLLHVLASVTNLCCVDKKGILSWANPTAEKIFFLKNRAHNNIVSRSNFFSSVPSLTGDDDVFLKQNYEKNFSLQPTTESECVLMTLTHDNQTAFGLQFDDPTWQRYLLSLKPLGLNVLLNTCNPATQDHYTQFCSHISCEAMYNEALVPVSQRRCLCELAKQIGFKKEAQSPFTLEHQLSTFRHVPPDMARKDHFARSLMITKLKFPFPHMVSVLMRDQTSQKLELMSQGTADIILDSCTDYWDGYDICQLTEKDRKKILDFYHRTSLSAYCTAFSYRPAPCYVRENLSGFYMELPLDSSHLYQAARTPTPHISTEALFGDEDHTEYEEVDDIDDCFRMQCKQIFIGMVTMQYQAKTDMVQMIEQLDAACIRFMHFSKENELRSRVFSEKMGLESGWNCHISLLSDKTRTESGNSSRAGQVSLKTSGLTLSGQSVEDINSPDLSRPRIRSSLEVSKALSHSAPSAINLDIAQVKFEEEVSICSKSSLSDFCHNQDSQRLQNYIDCDEDSAECIMLERDCEQLYESESEPYPPYLISSQVPQSHSPSHATDSSDHSATINFDMSNRARLPKGIENIRPHLESVDNVPLLVSLFTDCTQPTTQAMLQIMQEYTEVVIVMGSPANSDNMPLFMQADACIGIDPLYPQVCMQEPVFVQPSVEKGPSAVEIAWHLNSLPCSLSFHRNDKVSLVHLIMQARHFMQQLMSCLQFLACCSLSISLLQLLAAAAALPPLLSSGDILWLISVVVPGLSISLVAAPTNPAVANQATGKNTVNFNKEIFQYIFIYYACKFVPSVLVVVLCGGLTLATFCNDIAYRNNLTCSYVYLQYNSKSAWGGWGDDYFNVLNSIQCGVSLLLVLYFCVISISFVHRMYQIWKRNPLTNKIWAITVVVVLFLQVLYASLTIYVKKENVQTVFKSFNIGLADVPGWVWIIAFIWPVFLLPLNEAIKRREIRVNVRYQKRARLEFGTKLGMNSPF